MPRIDPTAKVHPSAGLAADVEIGPYAVVGAHVRIGPETTVGAHCVITGWTTLGARNRISSHAVLGAPPQDHTYAGEPTRLLIGDDNHIREFVTVNTGTLKGGGITIVGNHNMIMACAHIAHDCLVGDHNTIANCGLIAGHVKIEDGCMMSGHTAVHHFVTIGRLAMLAGLTGVTRDVPPFMTMMLDPATPRGVNTIGMQRAGYSDDDIRSVQRAFRVLYRNEIGRKDALDKLRASIDLTAPVMEIVAFLDRTESTLGRYLESTRIDRKE